MKQEFLEAAMLIDSGAQTYSCRALESYCGINSKEAREYAELMYPEDVKTEDDLVLSREQFALQRGIYEAAGGIEVPACRNLRVLLLLFAGEALS